MEILDHGQWLVQDYQTSLVQNSFIPNAIFNWARLVQGTAEALNLRARSEQTTALSEQHSSLSSVANCDTQ